MSKRGVTYPLGFKAVGIYSGIKKKVKKDLMILTSESPCTAAGVFTVNQIKAHCVVRNLSLISKHKISALIANSGNANCMTGKQGEKDDSRLAAHLAAALSVPSQSVLTASTGVIGVPMPINRILEAIPGAVNTLSAGNAADTNSAEAILTTDTCIKNAYRSVKVKGGTIRIGAVTKGSGMIAPLMTSDGLPHATMLAFITTDVKVSRSYLNALLKKCAHKTFNAIDVDGDMSTNDMVIALANGQSGISLNDVKSKKAFESAFLDLCDDLATQIVADGEGATMFASIHVKRAASDQDARAIAKAISESNLVKTALHGRDANWGRIAAAAGAAQRRIDYHSLSIFIEKIQVLKNGQPQKFSESAAKKILSKKSLVITVDLNLGKGSAVSKTCDLSYKYIEINADYRS